MELSLIFQIITTTAVILGIAFGIINLRNFQAMRKREAAVMMLNSFQTNEFVRETAFEWFQWLAERMFDRETTSAAIPPYIAHRNWKAGKKA